MGFLHKNIKRFEIDGEIYDEATIPRIKEQYIDLLKVIMQNKGYVIRYDIDPDFSVEYTGKGFKFILSVYGVFVGKRKAQCLSGIDKNRAISRPTQKSKSNESCCPAE
jgi:AAA15 family ATPase/GTPase